MKAVWIYVDTSKQVGDVDHLKVLASPGLADEWLEENDPEGVAFEHGNSGLTLRPIVAGGTVLFLSP